MNHDEVIKIPNPETRLNIVRRYMHVLALLQNTDYTVQWNAGKLADFLSMEEDIDGGLGDHNIRNYIKENLVEEMGFDIQTTKGSRKTVLATPISRPILEKIASVYLSFTATDSSRDLVLKRQRPASSFSVCYIHELIPGLINSPSRPDKGIY